MRRHSAERGNGDVAHTRRRLQRLHGWHFCHHHHHHTEQRLARKRLDFNRIMDLLADTVVRPVKLTGNQCHLNALTPRRRTRQRAGTDNDPADTVTLLQQRQQQPPLEPAARLKNGDGMR